MSQKLSLGGVRNWDRLREVAEQGFADAVLCLGSIAVVERSNREAVRGIINPAGAGRAARLLQEGALVRLHLMVTRAFAAVRYSDDLHLAAAIQFLEAPGVLDQQIDPPMRKSLEDAIGRFRRLQADKRLESLKNMRDKMLAHWAIPDPEVPLPTYSDLFNFTRATARVWDALLRGVDADPSDLQSEVRRFAVSANAFWAKWEGSP